MPILWKRLAFQFDLDRGNTRTLRARFGMRKETESAKSSANEGKNGSKKKVNNSSVLLASPRPVRGGGGGGKGSEFEQAFPPVSLVIVEPEEAATTTTTAKEPLSRGKSAYRNADSNGTVLTKKTLLEGGEATVEEILADAGGELRNEFAQFLKLKRAHEFLALYEDCARYELETQPPKLNELGRQIVQTYVLDNGPQSVDMESSLRKRVLELDSKQQFQPGSLLEVKAMALEMMQTNFYAQFLTRIEAEEE